MSYYVIVYYMNVILYTMPTPHSYSRAHTVTCSLCMHARRMHSRCCTVGFHNFKSQIFKLSVSNPKSKYVAYLSVLSRISNCQGLGRKNKHDILKTDRTPRECLVLHGVRLHRLSVA